ncbi:MAG: NifU family protein [Chitinophagaceae bacterium]|nr:MAG: NifU family protein [Chitinophagaceae bacterium]
MEATKQPILEIYTEMTPNPESMKFVVNKMLLAGKSVDIRDEETLKLSPLAQRLFEHEYVNGVFVSANFITISKSTKKEWMEIIPELKQSIKNLLTEGIKVIDEKAYKAFVDKQEAEAASSGEQTDTVSKIKELLDTYVKPAVEMDGGAIQFKSFNPESGKVTLVLQGACSGCPSSMLTLKAGIEGMLKRMLPEEVTEVVAESEDDA